MVRYTAIRSAIANATKDISSSSPESNNITRTLYESLTAIGSIWPKDSLRPETNFGQSIVTASEKSLTDHSTKNSLPPPQSISSQSVKTRVNTRVLQYRSLNQIERENVENVINALNRIKSGSASKEFPVPESVLRPASNPIYYTRLANMIQQAAKGNRVSLSFKQRLRLFFGMQI